MGAAGEDPGLALIGLNVLVGQILLKDALRRTGEIGHAASAYAQPHSAGPARFLSTMAPMMRTKRLI
jgi:hypothetical protein